MGAGRTIKGDRNLYTKEKRRTHILPSIRAPRMRGGMSARAGLSLGLGAIGRAFKEREDKRKKCCEAKKKRASALNYAKNINAYNNLAQKYSDEFDKTVDDRTLSGAELAETRTKYVQEKMTPMLAKKELSFPMSDSDYQNYQKAIINGNNAIYQHSITAGTKRNISNFLDGLNSTNQNNLDGIKNGTLTIEDAKKNIDTYVDAHKDLFTPEQEANYKKTAYDNLKKIQGGLDKEQYETIHQSFQDNASTEAENGKLSQATIKQGEQSIAYYNSTGDTSKALAIQNKLIKHQVNSQFNSWNNNPNAYYPPNAQIAQLNKMKSQTDNKMARNQIDKKMLEIRQMANKSPWEQVQASAYYKNLSQRGQNRTKEQYNQGVHGVKYLSKEQTGELNALIKKNTPRVVINDTIAKIARESGRSTDQVREEYGVNGSAKGLAMMNAKDPETYSALQNKKTSEESEAFKNLGNGKRQQYSKLTTSDIWGATHSLPLAEREMMQEQMQAVFAQAVANGGDTKEATKAVENAISENYSVMNKKVITGEKTAGWGGKEEFQIKNLLIGKRDEPRVEKLALFMNTKNLENCIDESTLPENKQAVGMNIKNKEIVPALKDMRKDKAIKWLQKNSEIQTFGNGYAIVYFSDGKKYILATEEDS